uniref:Acyl-coenzyme A oxidase n=1 Tax=Pyramimonas obovata TaxID=1411642 RepID=A0A7S0RQY7_9CHLO|eukprot:CAMPEP_0118933340 /NCGR_PEP_ID=MMETSP1169-20130426/11929_1 /TAXON_ID=36882 /ORGANISM="Pyramimonas obovata, Strain CCMP722" /LENGTH=473 /DNA_ID=CAMNT_0006876091 /DNA_START=98 /DNA_END=1519 /DNA_ORIENTATION=+
MNSAEWTEAFRAATVDVAQMDVGTVSYEESARRLRTLLKTKLLLHTDLRDSPERFFLAHRILATYATKLGPGFWIRFTVHYNLCVGTVLALGTEEQIASLSDMQEHGLLGCFGLTERLAGVSSGLVVNAVADWDEETDGFTINTLDVGAAKNWISQGLVADKAVVVAELRVKGVSHGPHAFFMDFRRDGEVVPGIMLGDMGKKTVGNDLDNAWIMFNNVKVPKSTLLNRYADIRNGKYVAADSSRPVFHMIGQRLFTGRVAVAQAALEFRRTLYATTKEYTDKRQCWTPTGSRPLSSVPQVRALFEENAKNQHLCDRFVAKCESELCRCLRENTLPSVALTDAIAVAKVKAVEDSIKFVHLLQNEVGSFALMKGTGFEQRDFLTCCKFAEGDTRVLMQKMARDRVKAFQKTRAKAKAECTEETALCSELVEAMRQSSSGPEAAWDIQHEKVYRLAGVIIDRTVTSFLSPQSKL